MGSSSVTAYAVGKPGVQPMNLDADIVLTRLRYVVHNLDILIIREKDPVTRMCLETIRDAAFQALEKARGLNP